jgi:hypothetical protein
MQSLRSQHCFGTCGVWSSIPGSASRLDWFPVCRRHSRLPVRAARVERPSASFSWLPASSAGVANSVQSSPLFRPARPSMPFGRTLAPLSLRNVLRSGASALLTNKLLKSDQRDVVMAFAKSAKATPTGFGALARR